MHLYPFMVSLGMPEGLVDEDQATWLYNREMSRVNRIQALRAEADKLERYLLNIEGTARKWTIVDGGVSPLALIAQLARDALGITVAEADSRIAELNAK